jgi:predicted DNA-binding transcriptional regulator AlpA
MSEQPEILKERETAEFIGVSKASLRIWRVRGEGPRHFRAGQKLIRYRRGDVEFWIRSRLSGVDGSPMRGEQ